MKSPLPTPRATLQRLADPGNFQPLVIITKEGLHAKVAAPERIQFPPNADQEFVTVYNTPNGRSIYFFQIERIEFDAGARKPIPFGRWVRQMRWLYLAIGFELGILVGVVIGERMTRSWYQDVPPDRAAQAPTPGPSHGR